MSKIYQTLKKKWKLIVLLCVVAIGFFAFINRNKDANNESINIKKGNLNEELVLSGEISATNYAKLSFETAGKITYVAVKEGDKVVKGKLLSKLDSTVLNSTYQIALSNLRTAEATAQNVLDQVKDNDNDETFAQKDTRTAAEANKDKAYEAVIQAKRNLDGASIYAPFNGIITYLANPFPNVFVSYGSTQIEIIDPSTMFFKVLADQNEVTKISVGQKVSLVLDAFEGQEYYGTVETVSFVPSLGEAGSVYSVKVKFDKLDSENTKFRIAMTGDAKFVISQRNDALYVPSKYVKQDKQGKYVKVDSKGTKKYVETGIESEDSTEIMGDLQENQVVYN